MSVFSSIAAYVRTVLRGLGSVWGSCMTALPYLLGIGESRKVVTEQYPDPISSKTVDDLPPRSRGLLYNDIERCTGCRDCEKVCPTHCIRIETELGPEAGKTWVAVYDIDFSRCIFCGLCVDSCQPASLSQTKQYEGAVYELSDLVASFGRGRVTQEQRDRWASIRQQNEGDEVRI